MDLDAPRPDARLRAVADTELLDTPGEEPFDRLISLARDLIGAPFAFVTIVDDQRSYWKSAVGVELGPGEPRQNPVAESFCKYVVADRRPLVLDDVREDPRTHDHPAIESMGVLAWAGYPILSPSGHVLGTFCVADVEPHRWTLMDVRVLRTLSLAVGTEIALRLRAGASERGLEGATQDRDAAHRLAVDAVSAAQAAESLSLALQHSLLTEPVLDGDVEVAVRYESARAHHRVGGDWYDAFDEPDGPTTLVIGDVAGHEVQAAAAMAQVRGFVRAFGYGTGQTPAQVLRCTDRAIGGLRVSGLVTAVVARLDVAADAGRPSRMCWSNAGHPPPLLRHPDGRVEVLARAQDLLLGVSSAADRADHEVALQAGSTVLLYTDGLLDDGLVDGGEDAGASVQRLVEIFADVGALHVQEAADLLVTALGRKSRDDVAVLVARVP